MGDAHSATHTIRVGDSSVYKKKKRRRRRMRMRMRMREIVEREETREGGWMEEGGGAYYESPVWKIVIGLFKSPRVQ